jgi:hypothetical protein
MVGLVLHLFGVGSACFRTSHTAGIVLIFSGCTSSNSLCDSFKGYISFTPTLSPPSSNSAQQQPAEWTSNRKLNAKEVSPQELATMFTRNIIPPTQSGPPQRESGKSRFASAKRPKVNSYSCWYREFLHDSIYKSISYMILVE